MGDKLSHFTFLAALIPFGGTLAWRLRQALFAGPILATLIFSGCTSTILPSHEPSQQLRRLIEANNRLIGFSVTAKSNSIDAGHQFLLIALPFGSVRIDDPGARLKLAAVTELAKSGYRPVEGLDGSKSSPQLALVLSDVSLSAYDFLFFRRLSCTVSIEATITKSSGQTFTASFQAVENSTNRFGFSRELDDVFDKALTKVSQDVIRTFNL